MLVLPAMAAPALATPASVSDEDVVDACRPSKDLIDGKLHPPPLASK